MTKDFPLDTNILSLFKYLQKIFLSYSIVQFPFSIFPFIFCSKLKIKFFVFFKFSIIFSLFEAFTSVKKKIKKKKQIFYHYRTSLLPT